jgi:hypothetical protein
MYGNRLLRTLRLKREEVTRSWRKQHNEKLHDLYPSQANIKVMIKSSMTSCMSHMTHMEEMGKNTKL